MILLFSMQRVFQHSLKYWGWVSRVSFTKLCPYLLEYKIVACLAPSHNLHQGWLIFTIIFRWIFQWNSNKNNPFSWKKINSKLPFAVWRPFRFGFSVRLDVLLANDEWRSAVWKIRKIFLSPVTLHACAPVLIFDTITWSSEPDTLSSPSINRTNDKFLSSWFENLK